MPTIHREGPFRFYFFSHDQGEPPHVHVDRDADSAKFWLDPVALARNLGFSPIELRRIRGIVLEQQSKFLGEWNGYFGHSGG